MSSDSPQLGQNGAPDGAFAPQDGQMISCSDASKTLSSSRVHLWARVHVGPPLLKLSRIRAKNLGFIFPVHGIAMLLSSFDGLVKV